MKIPSIVKTISMGKRQSTAKAWAQALTICIFHREDGLIAAELFEEKQFMLRADLDQNLAGALLQTFSNMGNSITFFFEQCNLESDNFMRHNWQRSTARQIQIRSSLITFDTTDNLRKEHSLDMRQNESLPFRFPAANDVLLSSTLVCGGLHLQFGAVDRGWL